MNPASLVPIPTAIPVHWAWIDILLILTFTVHILFMNTVVGGGVIALINSTGKNEKAARTLSRLLPALLALTINFGVAPLLFLQTNYGHFDYPGSVIMGGWWLLVIPAVLMAYYGLYIYDFKYAALKTTKRLVLGVALLFLLYAGFMLTNNMTIMLQPKAWLQYFAHGGGLGLNLNDVSIYPRFLHFIVGALAIGGLFLALVGRRRSQPEFIAMGMRWFTRATMVNICIGAWFLVALPREIMLQFMGNHTLATATLILGLLLTGAMLHAGIKQALTLTTILTVLTVLVMAIARHLVRLFYTAPLVAVQDIPLQAEYSPLVMFLLSLAAVLGLSFWMVFTYRKAEGRA